MTQLVKQGQDRVKVTTYYPNGSPMLTYEGEASEVTVLVQQMVRANQPSQWKRTASNLAFLIRRFDGVFVGLGLFGISLVVIYVLSWAVRPVEYQHSLEANYELLG